MTCQTTLFIFLTSAPNSVPIGIEDGKIPNGYITASSTYNRYTAPWLGRLNNKARGRFKGAWSAKRNNRKQWLQFNLGIPTLVTVIRTQGRQDANQWVTKYKLFYSNNGVRFTPYKKGGRVKVGISNYSSVKVGYCVSSFLTGSLNPDNQFKLTYDLIRRLITPVAL